MAFTNIDKNLLIASLESALIYAQHSAGVSSLEALTTQIAALRSAFDADPANVTESMLESMIAKLQALEMPDPEKLSRLLTTTTVSNTNTYLAVCSWATLLNKPTTFPPEAHTHPWSEISYKPISYPPETHTHVKADVSDFPATLPGRMAVVSWVGNGAASRILSLSGEFVPQCGVMNGGIICALGNYWTEISASSVTMNNPTSNPSNYLNRTYDMIVMG